MRVELIWKLHNLSILKLKRRKGKKRVTRAQNWSLFNQSEVFVSGEKENSVFTNKSTVSLFSVLFWRPVLSRFLFALNERKKK